MVGELSAHLVDGPEEDDRAGTALIFTKTLFEVGQRLVREGVDVQLDLMVAANVVPQRIAAAVSVRLQDAIPDEDA